MARWPKVPMKRPKARRSPERSETPAQPLTKAERAELEEFAENVRDMGADAVDILEFALGTEFCRRLIRQREGTCD